MNILIIYLYALKNAGHYEFVHSIIDFAEQCLGITTKLQKWYAPFMAAVEEEGRLLAIALKNVISEQLFKLDGQRDGIYSAIHGATNAMLKSVDSERVEAATYVMNELVSLKVNINDDYMDESGQIDTLVTVLLGAQSENVTKLGLLPLVQELKSVNDLMHELLDQRDREQFDRMNDSLAKARISTDTAYARFIRAVESYTYLHEDDLAENDEGFTQFVNDTNTRIEYFRRYVLKVNSRPEDSTPGTSTPPAGGETGGEGSEGEQQPGEGEQQPGEGEQEQETPTKYTATFVANGATVATQQYEAGEVINAPAAPSGYDWEDYPYRMPANDITVNAVRKNIPGGGGGSGFE